MATAKLGTVFTAGAKIYIFDEKELKKIVLVTCPDTPRHIGEAIAKLRKAGHKNLWSSGFCSERQYHG